MAERWLVETMPLQRSPHGPVLRAARDALCAAGLAAGVTLVLVEEWEALEWLNARHRGNWFPLLPRPAASPSFWVAAVDADGEFVATHGVVLLDCSAASFGARVHPHRLLVVDAAELDEAQVTVDQRREHDGPALLTDLVGGDGALGQQALADQVSVTSRLSSVGVTLHSADVTLRPRFTFSRCCFTRVAESSLPRCRFSQPVSRLPSKVRPCMAV